MTHIDFCPTAPYNFAATSSTRVSFAATAGAPDASAEPVSARFHVPGRAQPPPTVAPTRPGTSAATSAPLRKASLLSALTVPPV